MNKKYLVGVLSLIIFSVVLIVYFLNKSYNSDSYSLNQSKAIETNKPEEKTLDYNSNMNKNWTKQPEMLIDKSKKYTAVLNTTEGKISILLNASETPVTVNNFVFLAREGFYDNTIFHRVIEDFMIQGGDPEGTGRGGPGYRFDDEEFKGSYVRGTIAMANAGANTNGSQFFIMHNDYNLPHAYVIFGKVTDGIDVVDKIATAQVKPSFGGEVSTPVNPVKILSIEIEEK